jgi:hypothetical protein
LANAFPRIARRGLCWPGPEEVSLDVRRIVDRIATMSI